MDIFSISDLNGYIKIAALDHRTSLKKMLSVEEISKFKSLSVRMFEPYVSAVLLDPPYFEFKDITIQKPVLLSCEKSIYIDSHEGRITQLNERYPISKLKNMGASALKLLLYYNPDAPNKENQIEVAKLVKLRAEKYNLPFLLEIVTYPINETQFNKSAAIEKSAWELWEYCDILKIEYPEDQSSLSSLKTLKVPWVLLSRGMPFAKYIEALKLAKSIGGAKGFAVGRAVWQEIGNFKTWEEKELFIRNTAVKRMEEISRVFS